MRTIRYYVITYWMEFIAWVIGTVYMGYILIYYSWQAFIINMILGIIGWFAMEWFGHVMPIVGYFIRKWDREKQHGDKGRQ